MAGDRPEPPVPLLAMMIDRTSFDETDDYGVDQAALESTEWSKERDMELLLGAAAAPQPVMMRNGKVRRRLRWKPKSMMKKRPPLPLPTVVRNGSSNMSVTSVSNASNSSKNSKKSVHSFASTETMVRNNTKKGKTLRLPLPRPNYPTKFDGVATIGNEGDMVQARMADSNSNKDIQKSPSSHSIRMNSSSTSSSGSTRRVSELPPRKSGFPPLFKRKPGSTAGGGGLDKSDSADNSSRSSSTEETEFIEDGSDGTPSAQSPARTECSEESVPLPMLSGEEVERERRVDLRIRNDGDRMVRSGAPRPPASSSSKTTTNNTTTTTARQHALIEELRDAADEKSRVGKPQRTSAPSGQSTTIPVVVSPDHDAMMTRVDSPESFDSWDRSVSAASVADELRFSMSASMDENNIMTLSQEAESAAVGSVRRRVPSSPSPSRTGTCPVDVDDGSFLEAEKNLQAIHEMASEHLQQGEYDEALEVFEEILRGQLTRYGPDHFRVGTAYHNIGIVHMRRHDYDKAVDAYNEAIRVRRRALGDFHPDVAVSLAQLGVAFLEKRRHRRAISAFREALKIRRNCLGPNHPKVAKILNNIGCALYELNELGVARVAFEEALEIQRTLLRNLPARSRMLSESSLLSISSTQCNIASIKLYFGEFDAASRDLEEALLVQQCVLGDDHPVAQRTEDSLLWLERAKENSSNTPIRTEVLETLSRSMSSSDNRSTNRQNILCNNVPPAENQPKVAAETESNDGGMTFLNVFDVLEKKVMAIHAELNKACGAGDDSGDESSSRGLRSI